MYLAFKDERIDDIKFMTDGCGATIVCASYIARTVKGKTIKEALRIKPEGVDGYFEGLPQESKHCAKLAIDTLKAALDRYEIKNKM
jgi:nitrogen fixation NifU-like protein